MSKQTIRKFAVWLYEITAKWVVPDDTYALIYAGKHQQAADAIKQHRTVWPDDPEINDAGALNNYFGAKP